MIRCLLFGHKPSEMFEFARYYGVHRHTYCERCGTTMAHTVPVGHPFSGVAQTLQDIVDSTADKAFARLAEHSASPACWHDRERAKRPAKPAPLSALSSDEQTNG